MGKRAFDLAVAGALLLLLSPILLAIVLALWVQGQTTVFNFSPRVGRHGRPFRLLRFKTMRDTDLPVARRLTPVGRLIRNYSLDDLPNLVNVLKGDLSLVGPRPTEPARVELDDREWRRILTVRPGILSYAIWTLAADFNASDPALQRKLELLYVDRQSLWFDLQLIGWSLQKLMASRGNIKARGKPSTKR